MTHEEETRNFLSGGEEVSEEEISEDDYEYGDPAFCYECDGSDYFLAPLRAVELTSAALDAIPDMPEGHVEALLEVARAARVVVSQGSWGIIDHKPWEALREALRKLEETR